MTTTASDTAPAIFSTFTTQPLSLNSPDGIYLVINGEPRLLYALTDECASFVFDVGHILENTMSLVNGVTPLLTTSSVVLIVDNKMEREFDFGPYNSLEPVVERVRRRRYAADYAEAARLISEAAQNFEKALELTKVDHIADLAGCSAGHVFDTLKNIEIGLRDYGIQ